jgi:hypothetical protein
MKLLERFVGGPIAKALDESIYGQRDMSIHGVTRTVGRKLTLFPKGQVGPRIEQGRQKGRPCIVWS